MTSGIVYYSDGQLNPGIASMVRRQLATVVRQTDISAMVSVTLGEPLDDLGVWLQRSEPRGALTMFRQILDGLEAITTDVVYFCEHDVLYAPEHFAHPQPQLRYNQHVWKVDHATGKALHYRCAQTSGLSADRETLVAHYRKRIALVELNGFSRRMGFEPGTHRRAERVDDLTAELWMAARPNIDIRHATNLTASRWSKAEFRNAKYTEGWTEADVIPGWGSYAAIQEALAA